MVTGSERVNVNYGFGETAGSGITLDSFVAFLDEIVKFLRIPAVTAALISFAKFVRDLFFTA